MSVTLDSSSPKTASLFVESSNKDKPSNWQTLSAKIAGSERAQIIHALKANAPFNVRCRPVEVRHKATQSFETLKKKTQCDYGNSGKAEYEVMKLRDTKLIKQLILDASHTQKEFVFMDVGAGNFQWGEHLAKFLSEQTDIPKGLQFHIVSLRGETYTGEVVTKKGPCTLYNLGAFKIENLEAELRKHGLKLKNKVDLITSRLCFVHLVDSVGTYAQCVNLVRPNTGVFLCDPFFFMWQHDKKRPTVDESRFYTTRLLLDSKVNFLMHNNLFGSSFILKKPFSERCCIPYRYKDLQAGDRSFIPYVEHLTRFIREQQPFDTRKFSRFKEWEMIGDKKIYDWLAKHSLLTGTSKPVYVPLFADEAPSDHSEDGKN